VIGCSGLLREMIDSTAGVATLIEGQDPDDRGFNQTELLERLRRGDNRAFEQLVRENQERMFRTARGLLDSDDEARDAVQAAFVSAFEAIGSFNGSAKLSTWLHRIVVNAALMKLRRRRRKPERPIEDFLPRFDSSGAWSRRPETWAAASDELLGRKEDRALVRRCIDRLPSKYRTILMLRDIEELDSDEAANVLEITPNAVKVRLHHARQALRTLLAEALREGGERKRHRDGRRAHS
jgi:RNA polymerase sigma-70 factor (ECF subfamily)